MTPVQPPENNDHRRPQPASTTRQQLSMVPKDKLITEHSSSTSQDSVDSSAETERADRTTAIRPAAPFRQRSRSVADSFATPRATVNMADLARNAASDDDDDDDNGSPLSQVLRVRTMQLAEDMTTPFMAEFDASSVASGPDSPRSLRSSRTKRTSAIIRHDSVPDALRPSSEPASPDRVSVDRNYERHYSNIAGIIMLASARRQKEFHSLFRSVPLEDKLVDDYSCALIKDILVHGRMYITQRHVCFNSNIFGWVTNLVIPFAEILAIERKMTAFVIPNAIQITTLHSKYAFSSFLYRESAYSAMIRLWRAILGHDFDSLHFVQEASVVGPNRAATPLTDPGGFWEDSADEASEREKVEKPSTKARSDLNLPATITEIADNERPKDELDSIKRTPSAFLVPATDVSKKRPTGRVAFAHTHFQTHQDRLMLSTASNNTANSKKLSKQPTTESVEKVVSQFSCKCSSHPKVIILDEVIPVAFNTILATMEASAFFNTFWGQHNYTEISFTDWSKNEGVMERECRYIMPLRIPLGHFILNVGFILVGPKSTMTIRKQKLVEKHLNEWASFHEVVTTPDVPSGGSFMNHLSMCLMVKSAKETRILVHWEIEFTKSVWLRGAIERNGLEGNQVYWRDFFKALSSYFGTSRNTNRSQDPVEAAKDGLRQSGHGQELGLQKPSRFKFLDDLLLSLDGALSIFPNFLLWPSFFILGLSLLILNISLNFRIQEIEKLLQPSEQLPINAEMWIPEGSSKSQSVQEVVDRFMAARYEEMEKLRNKLRETEQVVADTKKHVDSLKQVLE